MLRAPMSRMDVLSEVELKELLNLSDISEKYNEEIDAVSAYEILNKKISTIVAEKKVEQKTNSVTSRKQSTRMNPILKVVTSATFIRGVFGILNKVLRK